MNKKELTEADIRTKFITPALVGPQGEKWNVMTQLREETDFTKAGVPHRGGGPPLKQRGIASSGSGLAVAIRTVTR
jgi:type I site-specific restriction endonuclease